MTSATLCVAAVMLCGIWVASEGFLTPPPTPTLSEVLSCFRRNPVRDSQSTNPRRSYVECQQLLRRFSSQDLKCAFAPIKCMFREYVRSR
ncbi:hypothetical protein Y032_0152g2873 [Ancylostoma ceylanicum]|uniref:Uncharacterized protein n=1 Tax=Ancylostoma ceylanicum TaxID=53326 RepID=A0A016T0H3_9BILA|nr:hypothetical protein Y032_0152g2873 [Ancylostoma ceylanicum]